MTTTQDKQLLGLNPEETQHIADAGGALTLKQLAIVANYSYEAMRTIANQPGFPLLAGKVTLEDYKLWRQRRLGLMPPLPVEPAVEVDRLRPTLRR